MNSKYFIFLIFLISSCSRDLTKSSGSTQVNEDFAHQSTNSNNVDEVENVPGLRTGSQYFAALVKTHGIARSNLVNSFESVKAKLPTSSDVMVGINADFWSASTVLAMAACEEAYRLMSTTDKNSLNTKEKISIDLIKRIYPTHSEENKLKAKKILEDLDGNNALNSQNFWKIGCATLSATLSFL